jgi:trimethylamine--corrinoid protein Co-methyltransferase
MQVHKTNYQVNETPVFQVLTEDQIEAIYQAALRVLYETGVCVYDKDGVEIADAAGAIIEDAGADCNLVKVPHWVVEKALATVPGRVVLQGYDRNHRMELYKNQIYFGGGADTPFTLDSNTGERRPTNYEDVKNMARLAQALPNLNFHMSLGTAQDKAEGTQDRWQYLAMVEGTSKPINVTATDTGGLGDILQMAQILVGGKAAWEKGPAFSVYLEPASPLSQTKEVAQMLIYAVDNHIPCVYAPCPLAGATAPSTMAGLLAQTLAESLFGIVISQTRRPGAQMIIGGMMSSMDMKTAGHTYGSPEMALLSAGYTDITKWLNVPMYETAGCSDSKVFDEQSVMEATINIATAALIGGNMIHNVGYLDSGLASCMEQMVAADEIVDMVKRILRGIPVDDETMALNVMEAVGPGGHYLDTEFTYNRFRTEIWPPKLIDRQNWEGWNLSGSKRYSVRANERVKEILETETEPLFDEATHKELSRICELADERRKAEGSA